jgi:hypothetical protein
MIYVKGTTYATLWSIEDKGTYSLVRMSTSRKDKNTGQYVNSNWSWVRFVKTAHEKLADVKVRDRITITSMSFSNEPYVKDGETCYPKNPSLVVFDFQTEAQDNSEGYDAAPQVEEETEASPF